MISEMTCVPSLDSLANSRLCYYTARVRGARNFYEFPLSTEHSNLASGHCKVPRCGRIAFNHLQLSAAAADIDEDGCDFCMIWMIFMMLRITVGNQDGFKLLVLIATISRSLKFEFSEAVSVLGFGSAPREYNDPDPRQERNMQNFCLRHLHSALHRILHFQNIAKPFRHSHCFPHSNVVKIRSNK